MSQIEYDRIWIGIKFLQVAKSRKHEKDHLFIDRCAGPCALMRGF